MGKRSLPAIIALNVVLLLALVLVSLSPTPATAQGFRSANYMMLSGPTTGINSQDVIYIVELNTTRVVAATYNASDDSWKIIDGTNMINALRSR